MIIGQAVPIGEEVAGIDTAVVASGLGVIALLNGLGRLAWGSISDKIGRMRTVMLMFVVMIIAFVAVLPYASNFAVWLIGMCLVGFSFGGFLAVMPSITADFYAFTVRAPRVTLGTDQAATAVAGSES
ncbi:MAG: OFA family MFS transporter [Actinobacteria bacterium]|nr:OFA family MFS transporter [Actinomycetota bacterium]